MPLGRIIASPPRVQHLDIGTAEEDIHTVLPEILQKQFQSVKVQHCTLGWRGYREFDEFILDKTLDLLVEGDSLDLQVYAEDLANSGVIGNIILYIFNQEGDRPVTTVLIVDSSEDDVVLSRVVRNAGICFIDGFIITITPHLEGGRVYRVISHFMIVDPTTAATRTSLLYTRLISEDIDARLLLTDRNAQVYYIDGAIIEEETVEDELEEISYKPGSIEELREHIRRDANAS